MTEKKIAILGTAASSVMKAPYDDKSWTIWNMSANYARNTRFDRWFELHTFDVLGAADSHVSYLKFMQDCGNKLIVGHPHDLIPDAELYPVEAIVEEFGNYFTCSAAWMIALAIHEKASEIGLWGIDMITPGEYEWQKPCLEHFLGIAKGRGIKVTLPPESTLLRAGCLYGFESLKFSFEVTAKMRAFDKEIEQLTPALKEAEVKLIRAQAKKELLADFAHRWGL